MIEIDGGQHLALIQLSPGGVSVNINLNLNNLAGEMAFIKGNQLSKLDPKRFRALLRYTDHTFVPDMKSGIPWKEQFLRKLSANCDLILTAKKLSSGEMEDLAKTLSDTNKQFMAKAKVLPDEFAAARQVSWQYHDGFRHLTRDDDFFIVRKGKDIVGMIPLAGNDYNELKKFLTENGDHMMQPENFVEFKKALMEAKRQGIENVLKKHIGNKMAGAVKMGLGSALDILSTQF